MRFESHAAGTFSWCDYRPTDRKAAGAFYSALWNWEYQDIIVHQDQVMYSLIRHEGLIVGGLSADHLAPDAQASWQAYVAVDDIAQYTAKTAGAGGTVLADSIVCGDFGTVSLIQDPQGAVFGLWQPDTLTGVQVKHTTGSLMWTELNVPDVAAAKAYYTSVFDWNTEDEQQPTTMYTRFQLAHRAEAREVAGVLGIKPEWEDHPAQWMVYFGVDDVAATLEQVRELGGTPIMGPMEIPVGVIGIFKDPWGAMLYIESPHTSAGSES